ncbi:unnamed protein product [Mytilus coruscus]|uniref:Uncharacterized protein n=1 Tax=Mytilus coruscus TaxID=42192 RepID=A0A6J8B214_MYTCO|nr:unnamed protein product [Mytilus coruscus]
MDKMSINESETGSKSISHVSTDEILDKVWSQTDEISDNENKSYTIISLNEATGHTSQIQTNCQSGENIDTVCTVCRIDTGQASTEMDKMSNNEDEIGSKSISTDEILDKVLPYKQEWTETDEISDNENKSYTIISLDEATGHTSQIQMNCQSGENIDTVCTVCVILSNNIMPGGNSLPSNKTGQNPKEKKSTNTNTVQTLLSARRDLDKTKARTQPKLPKRTHSELSSESDNSMDTSGLNSLQKGP